MSSNCSVNCCSSPEITSSNVSVSNMNGVSNEVSCGRVRTTVPDTKKDNKYWERRRRNNEAARRSREKRRQNDMVMDKRILELSQRNKQLENELLQLKMNFGLVNSNQPKLELDDSNGKLILPISVHDNMDSTKSSADHINGVVFPTFTAFSPTNETLEVSEKSNTESLNISTLSSKLNDTSKTCINSNKYQSNIITLGNIPFLSNLISPQNFNEDIASKATLLLPSLVPKTPAKTIDPDPCSSAFSNNPKLLSEAILYSNSQDNSNDSKKRFSNSDPVPTSTINRNKLDFHDILDLSIKQENSECFFGNTGGSPDAFSRQLEMNEDFASDNKECGDADCSPDNQSGDESMTNSFLSGILSVNPKGKLSVSTKRKSTTKTNYLNRLNNSKIRRCNLSRENMSEPTCSNKNKWHLNTLQHHLNLRTRLYIRREVSSIVINENRKLRRDIDSLCTEIKQLKSVMIECAKLSVKKPASLNHNLSISDPEDVNNLSRDTSGILVQVASSIN